MNEQMGYFPTLLSCAKSKRSINFVVSLKLEDMFFVDPPNLPQTLTYSMQLVFFTVERKFSQTKTFSQNVLFMFCL